RFVWDLKYPGPETLDISLAPARNKPLAERADPPAGPTVVPGQYRVEMTLGSQTMTAEFSVVKDPRLSTTPEDYSQQFELVRELTASLGKVNATVNHIRRLKHRLSVLTRSRDILPANTLLRGGFTTRSILVAARVCLFSGNTPTVMLSWSSFRSPTGRSPAYRRG